MNMNHKMKYLLVLVVTIIIQLIVFWNIRSHFVDVAATGRIYRAPAQIFNVREKGQDYVIVRIQHEDAKWLSQEVPQSYGQTFYVAVAPDDKGMLMIKGASLDVPAQGDYIEVTGGVNTNDGVARFNLPFNRFYMDRRHLESLPLETYENEVTDTTVEVDGQTVTLKKETAPKHNIIAEFRLMDGVGVITNVFVDGHSLLNLYNTKESTPTV